MRFSLIVVFNQRILIFVSGKYHFMAGLMYGWFGFNRTSKSVNNFNLAAESKPVKHEVKHTMILPLEKWISPASTLQCYQTFTRALDEIVKQKLLQKHIVHTRLIRLVLLIELVVVVVFEVLMFMLVL